VVQRNCASCHSPAEWSQASFLSHWTGQPVRDLHSFISGAMPLDSPGRLTAQEYTDIVAYMLKLNSVPTGPRELPMQVDSLRTIQVTARQR
jgi:cytochrome c